MAAPAVPFSIVPPTELGTSSASTLYHGTNSSDDVAMNLYNCDDEQGCEYEYDPETDCPTHKFLIPTQLNEKMEDGEIIWEVPAEAREGGVEDGKIIYRDMTDEEKKTKDAMLKKEEEQTAAFLAEGRDNAENAPIDPLPAQLLSLAKPAIFMVRKAWGKEYNKEEIEREINAVNAEIQRIARTPENTVAIDGQQTFPLAWYSIPAQPWLLGIEEFQGDRSNSSPMALLQNTPLETTDINALGAVDEILNTMSTFALSIHKKGFPFRAILSPEAFAVVARWSTHEKFQWKFNHLWTILSKADSIQLGYLDSAKPYVDKIVLNTDLTAVKKNFKQLEKINKSLSKSNEEWGLNSSDKTLPIEDWNQYVIAYRKLKDDPSHKAEYEEIKLSFLKKFRAFCLACGWNKEAQTLSAVSISDEEVHREVVSQIVVPAPPKISVGPTQVAAPTTSPPLGHATGASIGLQNDATRGGLASTIGGTPPQTSNGNPTFVHPRRGGPTLRSDAQGNFFTDKGKVTHVRRMGRGTYRIVVNAGTDNNPVMLGITDSELGAGVGDMLYQAMGANAETLEGKLGRDIAEFEWLAEFPQSVTAVRAPVRLWGVRWNSGERAVLTHSDVVRLCRKRFATETLGVYTRAHASNLQALETCKQQGKHPDTGAPLTEQDRQTTPWLFKD